MSVRVRSFYVVGLATISLACVGTVDISRHRSTMQILERVGEALGEHRIKNGTYPRSGEVELSRILPELATGGREEIKSRDAWGTPLKYMSSGDSYVVWSYGANREPDIRSEGGPVPEFDIDIVYCDGHFWQYFEGFGNLARGKRDNPFVTIGTSLAALKE